MVNKKHQYDNRKLYFTFKVYTSKHIIRYLTYLQTVLISWHSITYNNNNKNRIKKKNNLKKNKE